MAGVLTDTTFDAAAVVASAAPAPFPGEVAAAAADSFLPVAALQYLIDGVHSVTGFNWLDSSPAFKLHSWKLCVCDGVLRACEFDYLVVCCVNISQVDFHCFDNCFDSFGNDSAPPKPDESHCQT